MNNRRLISAGLMLGIGMGGFIDGILFHQILQTHNMLSARRPPDSIVNIEINMVWDGLFHALTWVFTAIGLIMLWGAIRRPDAPRRGRVLMGAMVMGWGAFNLVEGVVDHHLLHVHHVVERLGVSAWDWMFLAFGAALLAAGFMMIRLDMKRPDRARPDPADPDMTRPGMPRHDTPGVDRPPDVGPG